MEESAIRYDRVVDSRLTALDLVDILRSNTGASVEACTRAARDCLKRLLADESPEASASSPLNAVNNALEDGDLLDNMDSWDARRLSEGAAFLSHAVEEKKALSPTLDDVELCDRLKEMTEQVAGADARVVRKQCLLNDASLLEDVVQLYTMDQSDLVRTVTARLASSLARSSDTSRPAIVLRDSPLTVALTTDIRRLRCAESERLQTEALACLSTLMRLTSRDSPPPLQYLDHLDVTLFHKLLDSWNDWDEEHLLEVMAHCQCYALAAVEEAIRSVAVCEEKPPPPIGQAAISFLNRRPTNAILLFLTALLRLDEDVVDALFYRNDMEVLEKISTQLLANCDDTQIRVGALRLLESLVTRNCAGDATREALALCNLPPEHTETVQRIRQLLA